MVWNYRLCKQFNQHSGGYVYSIHSAYYDGDVATELPDSISEEPTSIIACVDEIEYENEEAAIDGIKWQLKQMLSDISRSPIVDYDKVTRSEEDTNNV